MERARTIPTLSPLQLSAGYFAFGVIWIPTIDVLLAVLVASHRMPTALGVVAGWTFVALSALFLFGLSGLYRRRMETTRAKLETATEQLQVLHRVFRHNIRNDLNVIHGYAELASERISNERVASQLEIVQKTAARVVDISDKFNAVDGLDFGRETERSVDAVALVESELERLRASHPAVTVTTDLPDRARVDGDESIRYAIREVFENAIEHHEGTADELEIVVELERDGDEILFEVADTGPGIPPEELRPLRSQGETPLVHTSSVGLWTVEWLCRLHGGSVAFDAEPGRGTSVSLRLGAARRARLAESKPWTGERVASLVK